MRRIDYFDGVRGLAAMQVLGDHYSSSFTGRPSHWLYFLTASDAAVFLFFLMSGFVLTPSFRKDPNDVALNMAKRGVRLGVPVAAALIVALLLHSVAPNAAARSAELSHSRYMIDQTNRLDQVSWSNYLADVMGVTMLAGYKETGLIAPLADRMPGSATSLDPPIWSLHIELWGSALVLLLVWASTQSRLTYLGVSAGAIAVIGVNPLLLFLVGHFCARVLETELVDRYTRIASQLLGALLVTVGIALCSNVQLPGIWWPHRLLDHGRLHTYSWFWWPHELGAIVLFAGILLSPSIQKCLSWPAMRYLGRMSFPVYLLHWPIMMVAGSCVYLWTATLGPRIAAAAALAAGVALTFSLAELFERWCDRPAVELGRRLGKPHTPSQRSAPALPRTQRKSAAP